MRFQQGFDSQRVAVLAKLSAFAVQYAVAGLCTTMAVCLIVASTVEVLLEVVALWKFFRLRQPEED